MIEMDVAVVGNNARGAALSRALIAVGHTVTTYDPAGEPPPAGAAHVDDVSTLLAAADVLVLCAEDADLARAFLERADVAIADHDVVDLTSLTSAQAGELGAIVTGRGGRYLDGALMAHPEHVGHPDTVIVYSGSEAAFARVEAVVRNWGRAVFLGTEPGVASLYDLALLSFAWATLTGYLNTAALLQSAQVQMTSVAPLLADWMESTIAHVLAQYAEQVDAGDYPGTEEWLELDHPLMENLVAAHHERGIDPALPRLVENLTARGIAAGRGAESFASLIEVLRPRTAA